MVKRIVVTHTINDFIKPTLKKFPDVAYVLKKKNFFFFD